ncbi:hypothetical protein V2J09_003965 [Rumex salicifolius]
MEQGDGGYFHCHMLGYYRSQCSEWEKEEHEEEAANFGSMEEEEILLMAESENNDSEGSIVVSLAKKDLNLLIGDWTTDLEKVEGVVEELWAQLRVRDARIALLTERKARLKAEKMQIEQRYHEHVKRLEEEVGKWLADKEGGTSSGAEEIGVAKPTNGEEPSKKASSIVFVVVYVDDILLTGSDLVEMQSLKAFLDAEFKIKDLVYSHSSGFTDESKTNKDVHYLSNQIGW